MCRRVPWITRPSFTISSLWRTTKWNPRVSWKDLSLSLSLATLAKKADSFRPARSIQQAFKLSTDPLAKRDDRPVSSTVSRWFSLAYALSFKCLFDIYRDLECAYIECIYLFSLRISGISLIHLVQGLTWSIVLEYMHRCSIGQHVIAFANRGYYFIGLVKMKNALFQRWWRQNLRINANLLFLWILSIISL